MEVHKHPHHVTHKKKWSEYLLEFLMLFLAVFLGFIAENRREHVVELTKEREYMASLVQDIKNDTISINDKLKLGETISKRLDSLVDLLNEENAAQNSKLLYSLVASTSRIVAVTFENRTSTQLKNSGNLRLVRNEDISDSIRKYFTEVSDAENIAARLEQIQITGTEIRDQIFHTKYFTKKNPANPFGSLTTIIGDPKLITSNPELIAQFSNKSYSRLAVLYNYLYSLRVTEAAGKRLIDLIKKEYRFE
jgi:hypothetical protein